MVFRRWQSNPGYGPVSSRVGASPLGHSRTFHPGVPGETNSATSSQSLLRVSTLRAGIFDVVPSIHLAGGAALTREIRDDSPKQLGKGANPVWRELAR